MSRIPAVFPGFLGMSWIPNCSCSPGSRRPGGFPGQAAFRGVGAQPYRVDLALGGSRRLIREITTYAHGHLAGTAELVQTFLGLEEVTLCGRDTEGHHMFKLALYGEVDVPLMLPDDTKHI